MTSRFHIIGHIIARDVGKNDVSAALKQVESKFSTYSLGGTTLFDFVLAHGSKWRTGSEAKRDVCEITIALLIKALLKYLAHARLCKMNKIRTRWLYF